MIDYLYDSDQDESLSSTMGTTSFFLVQEKMIHQYPHQQIWFNVIQQMLHKQTQLGMVFTWKPETYYEILVEYYVDQICKLRMRWSVPHESSQDITKTTTNSPSSSSCFFPNVPPCMEWISPLYSWDLLLPLLCYTPFIPSEWNLCHDMISSLEELKTYVTTLDIINHDFSLTPWNEICMEIIHFTHCYPSTFQSKRPKLGITPRTMDQKGGVGYSTASSSFITTHYRSYVWTLIDKIILFFQSTEDPDLCIKQLHDYGFINTLQTTITSCTLQELEQNIHLYINLFRLADLCVFQFIRPPLLVLYREWVHTLSEIVDHTPSVEEDVIHSITQSWHCTTVCSCPTTSPPTAIVFSSKQYFIHDLIEREKNLPVLTSMTLRRLSIEWKTMQQSTILPCSLESGSIYVCWGSPPFSNSLFYVLFIPSEKTPYFGGCFFFRITIPSDYPKKCPTMVFLTTGNHTVRFNPNLYACGKICLSLLGTWTGEAWDPILSNLTQLMLSILTMIFVDDPYFNEPGYAKFQNTPVGIQESIKYNQSIQYFTLKWAVYEMVFHNPFPEFQSIIDSHFMHHWQPSLKPIYQQWMENMPDMEKKKEMSRWIDKITNHLENQKKISIS